MPISIILTDGVVPSDRLDTAVARITAALLEHHGLAGNALMTRNVTTQLHVMPRGRTYSGGVPVDGAWIETKTPSFALADRAVQLAFYREATEILQDLSGGRLTKERIWSNGVHAVDGTWNVNGTALTNQEFGAALAAA